MADDSPPAAVVLTVASVHDAKGARVASSPTPLVFGPAGAQLFGLWHRPEVTKVRGVGVILCPPLGYEAMCTHRTYRHLAERLASAGFHVLRFDYHGTGDSSGSADEPRRVGVWLENIASAIDELKAISGVAAVDLVGVRLGGTLAAVAASARRDTRSLVLWAPCLSGRRYVRELRAFQALKRNRRPSAPRSSRRAGEEVAGYWFDETTLSDLAAIDLTAVGEPRVERALLLPRDDLPAGEAQLAAHLDALGVDATVRTAVGYGGMMLDPQDAVVPHETLDAIVSWLAAPTRAPGALKVPAAPARPMLVTLTRATKRVVHEEPVRFGEDGRLFGIMTEAGRGPLRARRPAVIFLNVGANHHVGPNRMYVSLARDLAAQGYLCLRFDRAGLGDSPAREGMPEGAVYTTGAVDDVAAAVTLLCRVRAAERVVLVGVCSGAHLAFHAGFIDPRVAGQVLINPQTLAWTAGSAAGAATPGKYKSTRYYLWASLQRAVWTRAARGEVDLRGVASVLRERLAARARSAVDDLLAQWRGRPAPRTEIEEAFCAMSDRGVESLLVFSKSDGGLDMIEEHLGHGARRVRSRRNIRLTVVPGADHTFTPVRAQRAIATLVTSFVKEAFP